MGHMCGGKGNTDEKKKKYSTTPKRVGILITRGFPRKNKKEKSNEFRKFSCERNLRTFTWQRRSGFQRVISSGYKVMTHLSIFYGSLKSVFTRNSFFIFKLLDENF